MLEWLVCCSVATLLVSRSAVEPAPVTTQSVQAIKFMKRFGYLDPGLPDSEELYSEAAIIDAIKNVQHFGAIPETGKLDNRTMELMNSKRCGVPDVTRNGSRRAKRYIVGSQGWKKREITYFLANWSPKIGEEAAVEELRRAFESWSGYARLVFKQVRDPSADIIIAFGRGPHGDGYPFDGAGNILAHAFYPYEMGSYGGDIHFDDDEQWTLKPKDSDYGVDFFTVAVHELGHSLGLAHSPVSSSIMFPYYKGYQPNFQLDYDDILAMYELYISRSLEGDNESTGDNDGQNDGDDAEDYDEGNENSDYDEGDGGTGVAPSSPASPTAAPTASNPGHHTPTIADPNVPATAAPTASDPDYPTPTTVGPTVPAIPDICRGHYDAVAVLRTELFVFKGQFVWRLSDRNELQPGYPVQFRYIFSKIPESVRRIDCAYQRETDQSIILFTGDMYWVFDGDRFVESPRSITEYGLPNDLSHVDACMVWAKNGKTFLFSGEQYWRFNETTRQLDPGYPHNVTRWRGVPSHLDSVMTWTDGLTYFFKGPLFWKFNNTVIKTEDSYPQEASTYWLGCS